MSKTQKKSHYSGGAFYNFIRFLVKLYVPRKWNIHFHRSDEVKKLEPPYFIFGNHTNFLDPFVMGLGYHERICFVTNEEYFRIKSLGAMLRKARMIPKAKFISDARSVKGIMQKKEENAVIGIYPEGGRTWPGETQPLLFPTSKLVKQMRIPVVGVKTYGGSLAFPRWSKSYRRGRVEVVYDICLTVDQIDAMSTQEIHEAMTAYFAHNEREWNDKAGIKFKGKKLAERMELFIFWCPKCGKLETMVSSDDTFTCSSCGYSVKYTVYGLLTSNNADGRLDYDDLIKWNRAQITELRARIAKLQPEEVLLKQENVTLHVAQRRVAILTEVTKGTLTFTPQGLVLDDGGSDLRIFDYKEIHGLTTNHSNTLDFYYATEKWRMKFETPLNSGYLWECAVKGLRANNNLDF